MALKYAPFLMLGCVACSSSSLLGYLMMNSNTHVTGAVCVPVGTPDAKATYKYNTAGTCVKSCNSGYTNTNNVCTAADESGADEADPSCSLQRGDNVQYGCGYAYQDTTNAQAQCGATEPVAFIWDDTEKSACGINRGDIVQKCSKYIYQKESDANAQCVAFGGTNTPVPFIPTE